MEKPPLRKRIVTRLFGDSTEPFFPPPPGSKSRFKEEAIAKDNPFLQKALEEEKLYGQRISFYSRTVALFVVGILLLFVNPRVEVLYYQGFLLLFILIGYLQLRVAQVGQSRVELFLLQTDFVLLAAVLLIPNPLLTEEWPTAFQYRYEPFVFFFLLLAAATLAYSWRTIMAIGLWVTIIWMAGATLIAFLGNKVIGLTEGIMAVVGEDSRLFEFLDPNAIHWGLRIQELVVFVLVTFILGLKSWRSNRLLYKQAEIAVERANLARYFPQSLADDLASRSEGLGEVRSQNVAVLFADVVGFTSFAENNSPELVIGTLRELHKTLEGAVFANRGTLDKYLGDGIMATFGTPHTTGMDALNAISSAIKMQDDMTSWNERRKTEGLPEVHLSIGIHYGSVVLGDIGTERRMEFAALGDTVNVAARLESSTRALGCKIILSDDLMKRACSELAEANETVTRFKQGGSLSLKGRESPVDVWTWK